MTITERTLREWRRQALREHMAITSIEVKDMLDLPQTSHRKEMNERILKLTQELLDMKLMRR